MESLLLLVQRFAFLVRFVFYVVLQEFVYVALKKTQLLRISLALDNVKYISCHS